MEESDSRNQTDSLPERIQESPVDASICSGDSDLDIFTAYVVFSSEMTGI